MDRIEEGKPLSQEQAEALNRMRSSQLGQDLWVLQQTGFKRGGYFVEFGALDGIELSNTYLLEKEFGWQGLCAEPNPREFDKLKRNRRCVVSDACIGAVTGQSVEFVLAHEFGGVIGYEAAHAEQAAKREEHRQAGDVVRLVTVSLQDFLVEHRAPRVIDYLSIDTEGSELDILQAFPFEQWTIRLLTVEHNFLPPREKIRELLGRHGYGCTGFEWDDWFVLARDP